MALFLWADDTACKQRVMFFQRISTYLADFSRFSALRRLCSALISHLGFSLSLIFSGTEARELQTQILEEHLGICHLLYSCTFSWASLAAAGGRLLRSGRTSILAVLILASLASRWLGVERAMNNLGTSPWMPVYAATLWDQPPFLKYRILVVTVDMLDCPSQHLPPWCVQPAPCPGPSYYLVRI